MMQYGTSFLRQRAGSQQTISIGSTLWGITTSLAALFSMRVVTWLRPYLITTGFLVCTSLPSFFCLVSGWYFLRRRRSWDAWFLSIAALNWLMAGGTLRRISIIFFIR